MNENIRKLQEMEYIPTPEKLKLNDIVPYSRTNVYDNNAYRGENEETGMAMYGQGLYSTTNRNYAKQYGKVRKVEFEELPAIPISLKAYTSFNYLEQLIMQEYGIDSRADLYSNGFQIKDLIMKMGYDGVAIGTGKDRIIVKY